MKSGVQQIFSFPNPVNETSARLVATGVVAMAALYLTTGSGLVLAVMTYGFWARVLTGPTLSPLGRLVTGLITPRLRFEHRFVSGPPKRFAQGIGAAFTTAASVAHFGGSTGLAVLAIGLLAAAASLEAFAGYCLGCAVYGRLIRLGLLPADDCPDCADIGDHLDRAMGRHHPAEPRALTVPARLEYGHRSADDLGLRP